ncbi:unnamed protein product [Ilex paraguariensis]|uniref:Leucine-rich repeat-containing N-terminal plant-type domain-containing protein n=1 Tax=Ilex paraguariensis TaxID=185542 RepID=A0ABC8T013_9AQUA
MGTSILTLVLLMFLLIIVGNSNSSNIICHEKERTALLNFRNDLTNPSLGSLSSWSVQKNCCQWTEVRCDNVTGRVIELDLHSMDLQGYNFGLFVDDLSWIAGLHSLKYLDMSGVDLSKTVNWLQEMNKLPSLSELNLSFCRLESMYPSLSYVNFTSLTVLDLSRNLFKHEIPNWLGNLSNSLIHLRLSKNALQEILFIPQNSIAGVVLEVHFAKPSKLKMLAISRNPLSFNVSPNWIPPFQLTFIDMSFSKLLIGYGTGFHMLKVSTSLETRFMSLSEDSFIGNAELCGAPLRINSTKDEESHGSTPVQKNGDESEMFGFYIGMGMGFFISFWGVCVVLFFKRTWRHPYFKFLNEVKDQIYMAALLKANWLYKKFIDS